MDPSLAPHPHSKHELQLAKLQDSIFPLTGGTPVAGKVGELGVNREPFQIYSFPFPVGA